MAELKIGDQAPAFDLPGSDGKRHKLADANGKRAVVLAWFPKAFTGGWTAECKSLRESGDLLREFDVAYFAASTDKPETNKEFAESLALDYPILSDPDGKVAEAYGVRKPIVNVASRVTFYIGKDGRVLDIDKNVKASTHGQAVATRLEELGVPKKRK